MTRDLIAKELRLNIAPGLYLMLLLAMLLLIPAWPFYIAFGYVILVIMIVAQTDKANNDLLFTALLPVRKRDMVTARTWVIVGWEMAYVLLGAVFAVVHHALYHESNVTGMNPNVAFFGTIFVMYAIFNAIYLPGAYTKPYRMLRPLLGGAVAAVFAAGVLNTVPLAIPAVAERFNDRGLGNPLWQLAALVVGLAVYVGATMRASAKAASNFEQVNL
jgi:hypothetical protein